MTQELYTIKHIGEWLGINQHYISTICSDSNLKVYRVNTGSSKKPMHAVSANDIPRIMKFIGYVKVEQNGRTLWAYERKIKDIRKLKQVKIKEVV